MCQKPHIWIMIRGEEGAVHHGFEIHGVLLLSVLPGLIVFLLQLYTFSARGKDSRISCRGLR